MKECVKCHIPKHTTQFRTNKYMCMKCEIETIMIKVAKYQSNNIGLENLDTSLENIIVKSKYLNSTYLLPLESTISLVKEGKAQVYKPDMIYMINHEKNSWIVKYNVFERDSYTCHYCGDKGDTVDHIHPKSKGGEFTEENLVCCCSDCNLEKGDMNYEEYKKYLLLPKWQRKPKTPDEVINHRKEIAKKQSRISNVLLKNKQKYGY